jgi:hypothetical protein
MILELLIRASLGLLLLTQSSAPPQRLVDPTLVNPTAGDVRMNQFEDPKGASWRVFAVDAMPDGPIAITAVEEVRQQNPPSKFAVYAGNRELMSVESFTLAAAVVDVNGKVKATQPLAAIKNLKPQQVQRREIPIRITIVAPTDRIVFYVKEVKSEARDFKAVDAEVAELIKKVAQRLPVP